MNKTQKLTASQFIALGYLVVILLGALILCTPLSSSSQQWTNLLDALFTATSATCVTGLVTVDTGTYWSIFGQVVILVLIQIGGIGFMAVISMVAIVLRRKINLHERKIIMQASGSIGIGGVIGLLKKILIATACCELVGASILCTQFIPMYGIGKGIYYSIFHSISAFCNAGFDIIGNYASFTAFKDNIVINLTLMGLIITGGLGFLVWSDLISTRAHWKKLQTHSKIVIVVTLCLIFIPAILFFAIEYNQTAFQGLSVGEKVMASFFQSVTCRTAGFNTIDINSLTDSSMVISIVLMFVGGSPGSTAGGIKTTTYAVLILSILCAARRKSNIIVGKKQLDNNVTKQASAIAMLYVFMIFIGMIIILFLEVGGTWADHNLYRNVMFEVVSAIGTVGLSAGGTPSLTIGSQIILMFLMYFGRIGALAIIYIFSEKSASDDNLLQRPTAKILVG